MIGGVASKGKMSFNLLSYYLNLLILLKPLILQRPPGLCNEPLSCTHAFGAAGKNNFNNII